MILDWSEVWALLIPLFIILLFRPAGKTIRPVVLYVITALAINTVAVSIAEFNDRFPDWLKNNNLLYNIHSFIRVVFLIGYFRNVIPQGIPAGLKLLAAAYGIFVLVNFLFFDNILYLSSYHFAAESVVLLVFCLYYFFRVLQESQHTNWFSQPAFQVAFGLSLYEVITFFVFLFFYVLHNSFDSSFARTTMLIYQLAFVLLCVLLALAIRRSARHQQPKGPQ